MNINNIAIHDNILKRAVERDKEDVIIELDEQYLKMREDLDTFHRNNIQVIPISLSSGNKIDVRIKNNTKNDFKPLFNHTKSEYNREKVLKAIDEGIVGHAIITGKKSNIICIDYDYHDVECCNDTILETLINSGTLYITTPTGGYHFIFRYDKRFKANNKIFGNIDIKTDNGLLFYGIRSDGQYKIHYNDAIIKKIPDDIAKQLLEYKKPITEYEYKEQKDLVIDDTELSDVIDISKGYAISEKELLSILYDLPNVYNNDFTEWATITYILKKEGFGKVWNSWSKLSSRYNKSENIKLWNSYNISNEVGDINYIIKILNDTTFKNSPLTTIKRIYKKYTPLNKANKTLITKTLNIRYLDKKEYDDGKDIIISSGLNTGKTFSVRTYIKNNDLKVLSIVALVATHDSHYQAFKRENIECYSYNDIHTNKPINGNTSIFTTIDSLHLFKHKGIDFKNYVVFLDEIHSLILYLLKSETLHKHRRQLFAFFITILKQCKQIIAVDGDICNNTITLLKILQRNPFKFVRNSFKSYDGIKCYKMNDFKHIIELMIDDIKHKRYFTCCCNTKSTVKKLKILLAPHLKNVEDLIIYTADEGETIKDINTEWSNKFIIYSPTIVAGLDFNPVNPINTYCFIDGGETLNPEQIGQQICRNRNINEVFIYISGLSNKLEYDDKEKLIISFKNPVKAFKSTFNELIDTTTSDDGSSIEYRDNIYTTLLYELEYQTDIMKSSYEYNLYEILEKKGFVITKNNKKNVTLKDDEKQALKEELQEDKDDLFDKYINQELPKTNKYNVALDKVLDLFNLSKDNVDELIKYKHIINDEKEIKHHLNITLALRNKDEIIDKIRTNINNDFYEQYYKSAAPCIIKYNEIMIKYLPEINRFTYSYNHDDTYLDDEIDIDNNDYLYVKSIIRSKKHKPVTKRGLVELMNLYVKYLFGGDIIKREKQYHKSQTKYSYSFNDELFKTHIDLYRYTLNKHPMYLKSISEDIRVLYYNDITMSNVAFIGEDETENVEQPIKIERKTKKQQVKDEILLKYQTIKEMARTQQITSVV